MGPLQAAPVAQKVVFYPSELAHRCLRLNWRDAFTKEDEEKAMSYLLGRYSDFVDRRGGSVWQDGCEHYRSNGVLLESHVAALLKEEREKAELPTSVGQEEDP